MHKHRANPLDSISQSLTAVGAKWSGGRVHEVVVAPQPRQS
jgi:hypothetical protein